jgi:hypothetical protein
LKKFEIDKGKPDASQTANDLIPVEQMRPMHRSFTEFKKQLDASASYVVAEKPSTENLPTDRVDFNKLAARFEKIANKRYLIYDSSINKLILIIKLAVNVDGRFFQNAISTNAMQSLRVYLYSSQ